MYFDYEIIPSPLVLHKGHLDFEKVVWFVCVFVFVLCGFFW